MRIRILVISNNPTRPSFRLRIGAFLPFLRENGIDAEVAKLPAAMGARRKLFARAADFNAVLLHKKRLNLLDGWALRHKARHIIYDFDDAVMYSPHNPDRDSRSHFSPFRRTARLVDTIIAGNSYLADHARRFNPNVHIIPTGLDTMAYHIDRGGKRDDCVRLGWIGSKSTLGYLEEIRPALEQLGKRFENLVLRVICNEFFDLENMRLEKCEWSEQRQYTDLAHCDIGLAPLPDNRFTRGKCGFKILQYFAASLPVITSPVGVNAKFVKPGHNGFHASSEDDWVQRIAELVENADNRVKMGENAAETAREFDVETLAPSLLRLVEDSIGGRRTHA